MGADDAGLSHCGGEIRIRGVLTLGAEHAVDPSVLMLGQTHIVDIGLLRTGVRQNHRIIPEVEAIDAIVTFCHRKEGFPVISFHTNHQIIFSVELNGSGVHHGVDAQTLLKIRVGFLIEVISPVHRCKLPGQDRILIPVINSIVKITLLIFSGNKLVHLCLFHIILFMKHRSSS